MDDSTRRAFDILDRRDFAEAEHQEWLDRHEVELENQSCDDLLARLRSAPDSGLVYKTTQTDAMDAPTLRDWLQNNLSIAADIFDEELGRVQKQLSARIEELETRIEELEKPAPVIPLRGGRRNGAAA
jgi:hypothetical protein